MTPLRLRYNIVAYIMAFMGKHNYTNCLSGIKTDVKCTSQMKK